MNLAPYQNEPPPRRTVLSGGAVLLEVEMESAHSVSLGVWLRRGSRDETPQLAGLSHFLEHMVFKGSTSRSAFEIAAAFDSLGAMVDAFTTKDYVAFSLRVLPEYFAQAVEVLADMVLRPALDPAMVALEQEVVCEEIQEAFDTPEDRLHDAFAAHIYGGHPRGRPILGTPESVRGLDAAILQREHRRLFAGSNLVLSLAGNLLDPHRDLVTAAFAPALAGAEPTTDVEAAPPPGQVAPRLRLTGPVMQSYFEIGNLGVPFLHEDRIPVFLLSNLLGGGMSSRIFQAVREREGLAYTVYVYNDMGRDVGLVSCAGSCTPEKQARVEEVIRAEYGRLIAEGPDADELANNQAQIKSQLVFALEGVTNQMVRAAKNEIYFGRFVPMVELMARVDAVDRDTLVACAETYFHPDRIVVASHGPESAVI